MLELFSIIEKVAGTASTVLVSGESGTGKELIARALHDLSDRASGPFVVVNCGAIPEHLIESELFGHIRGAFTNADEDRVGLFVAAHNGTIFLDEVGELPLQIQGRLLRTLQAREVRPLGSNESVAVNVRVVSATHKDLSKEITEGRFRQDLFYRLNVIPIHAPPLRARCEDIPLLADAFLREASGRLHLDAPQLKFEVLDLLVGHSWPGNVRELHNVLEYALVVSKGEDLSVDGLPDLLKRMYHGELDDETYSGHSTEQLTINLKRSLSIKQHTQSLERALISRALKQSGWVKSKAAERLEISTKTLLYKIKNYNIKDRS